MTCILVAAACWVPPIPLQPLPPPPPLVRSELQEHGWRLPAPEVVARAPSPPAPSPPAREPVLAPPPPAPTGVEQWRTLVTKWFGDRTDEALAVIACESGGNQSAVNSRSGAAGLFQHLPRYWPERSAAAGWAAADIIDAEANIAVAAWLSRGGTDWTHWECRP